HNRSRNPNSLLCKRWGGRRGQKDLKTEKWRNPALSTSEQFRSLQEHTARTEFFQWQNRANPVTFVVRDSLRMKAFSTITVIGRDKTGVVARITGFLFEQKANIEALEEQVTRGQFSMTVQTSWNVKQLDGAAVCGGLQKLASALDMEIKI